MSLQAGDRRRVTGAIARHAAMHRDPEPRWTSSARSPATRPRVQVAVTPALRAHAIQVAPRCLRARLVAMITGLVACAGTPRAPAPAAPVGAETRAEIQRAEAAELERRHDRARAHYERAIAVARDADSAAHARHAYAETLVSWGEPRAALAQLERAVAARPGDPGTWHDLGLVRHATGDDAGALAALARAEQLAPDDVRPRTALAALYWRRGDRASAAREYRAMLALDLPERLRAKVEWALAELAKP